MILRVASHLAPGVMPLYAFLAEYLADRLGYGNKGRECATLSLGRLDPPHEGMAVRLRLAGLLLIVGVSGCGTAVGTPEAASVTAEPTAVPTAEPTTLDPVAATLAECEDAPEPAGEPVNLRISANSSGFDTDRLEGPRHCEPFTITFDNNDTDPQLGLHNVTITLESNILSQVTNEEPFAGPGIRVYEIPALPAGEYTFICTKHIDFMKGTLVVSAS